MSKKLYMVEVVSTFHLRFLIEADSKEEAESIVKNPDSENIIDEFSQRHIGEEVIATHKIKESKAIKEFRKDNDYVSNWSDEFIKEKMICNKRQNKETALDLFGSL